MLAPCLLATAAYTTSGSIQAFPGPAPAPPPPAPVHAAVDWSAAPVRVASTAATVEVDVMPFLGRTPEGGPFDAYRTVSHDEYSGTVSWLTYSLIVVAPLLFSLLVAGPRWPRRRVRSLRAVP